MLQSFDPLIMINLESRPERLQTSLGELKRVTGKSYEPGVDLQVVRPKVYDETLGFDSKEVRSNLNAHLDAAKLADSLQLEFALVFEDDIFFGREWNAHGSNLLAKLREMDFDLACLGYQDPLKITPGSGNSINWIKFDGKLHGAYAYVIHSRFYDKWINYLEQIAEGTSTEQYFTPVGADGAINNVQKAIPTTRLIVSESIVDVRPYVSDITPNRAHPFFRMKKVGSALVEAKYKVGKIRRKYYKSSKVSTG